MITRKQYQRLMSEYKKTGKIEVSAMKADVHPQTAAKYIGAGKAPAELQAPHTWRTRPDPLERVWEEAMGVRSGKACCSGGESPPSSAAGAAEVQNESNEWKGLANRPRPRVARRKDRNR